MEGGKKMLKRIMSKFHRGQRGITGLETAIILIAFVVVASVFAYTVLSAGIFSTQKSSEAVYSGLEEAQSSLELKGPVIAFASDPDNPATVEEVNLNGGGEPTLDADIITRLQFTVANVLGGEPIDLTPPYTVATTVDPPTDLTAAAPDEHVTIITYDDQYNHFADCFWTVDWIGEYTDDNLLADNEKAVITVWLVEHDGTDFNLAASGNNNAWFDDDDDGASTTDYGQLLGTDHTFTLQVKPNRGAVLAIERTTPSYIDAGVMDLN